MRRRRRDVVRASTAICGPQNGVPELPAIGVSVLEAHPALFST
jgi:hypothetical protein